MQSMLDETSHASLVGQPQFRCKNCGRLLFKGLIQKVEIKCPRCNTLQTFACSRKTVVTNMAIVKKDVNK